MLYKVVLTFKSVDETLVCDQLCCNSLFSIFCKTNRDFSVFNVTYYPAFLLMGTAICFLVNMTGRFLIGVVLVLVLGLGLTSSHVIDDISKDLIDKFDEVKASLVDNKQLQADTYVSDGLVKLILKIYNSPEVKGKCEKEAKAKREEWKQKQKNLIPGRSSKLDYQALIHLKKSFAADGTWLEAMESEACSVCVLNKLCDDTDDILKRFKFDSSFSK